MLNAVKTYGRTNLYACDISKTQCAPQFEENTETGFAIPKYFPKYLNNWKLHAPGFINKHLDKIGKDRFYIS